MGQVTYDLQNEVVIVTGAARGVGRAIVTPIRAGRGARAGRRSRRRWFGRDGRGPRRRGRRGRSPTSAPRQGVDSIVGGAVDHFGRLDICVNNAAVAPHASLMDERLEVWDTVVRRQLPWDVSHDPSGRQGS